MNELQTLVAHRPPLLLLDEVLEIGQESASTRVRVDPGAWYADGNGDMPAWFGLELMAQTIAAFGGASRLARGETPGLGYLLGTRAFTCQRPAFPAGCELEVRARLVYLDETGLSAFQGSVFLEGTEVASALLKTYEPPRGESPLSS